MSRRSEKNHPICFHIRLDRRNYPSRIRQCWNAYCRSYHWRLLGRNHECVLRVLQLIHTKDVLLTSFKDMTIPIYNSEIAPPAKRGMIAGLHAQMVGVGFAVANVSSFSIKPALSATDRRV